MKKVIMTSKLDYDAETRTKNRGTKARENWICGQCKCVLKSFKYFRFFSARKNKKRKRIDLEDDDFDLIEENLGVKLKKRKKFSRLRTVSSDEEQSDDEVEDRDAIGKELFQDDDDEDAAPVGCVSLLME